jgi:hypothetical protein
MEERKETFFERGQRLAVEQKAEAKVAKREILARMKERRVSMPKLGASDEESLRHVGYTQRAMSRILSKSGTNSEFFALALAREGIGPEQVAKGLVEGLNAGTPMVRKGVLVVDPVTKEKVLVPDYHTRLAYWDRIIAIVGAAYKSKDEIGPQVSPTFIKVIQIFDSLPPEDKRRVIDGDFTVLEAGNTGGNGNGDPKSRF